MRFGRLTPIGQGRLLVVAKCCLHQELLSTAHHLYKSHAVSLREMLLQIAVVGHCATLELLSPLWQRLKKECRNNRIASEKQKSWHGYQYTFPHVFLREQL